MEKHILVCNYFNSKYFDDGGAIGRKPSRPYYWIYRHHRPPPAVRLADRDQFIIIIFENNGNNDFDNGPLSNDFIKSISRRWCKSRNECFTGFDKTKETRQPQQYPLKAILSQRGNKYIVFHQLWFVIDSVVPPPFNWI